MTKHEKVLDGIRQSDILYVETRAEKIPAQSIKMEGECAIFFDEKAFETDAERAVALAHEKGHCDSGAFYTIHTPFETRGRCEHRAWKHAIVDLVPLDELMDAFEACRTAEGVTTYDLADYLGVTDDFVVRAVEQYVRWGELIL